MASAARDKLQASARELMKNWEDYAKKPRSKGNSDQGAIETALRAIFSSCTSGADQTVIDSPEQLVLNDDSDSIPSSPEVEKCSRQGSRLTQRSQSATAIDREAPPPPPAKNDLSEHIYAQLFYDDQLRAAKAVNTLRADSKNAPTTPQSANVALTRHITPTHHNNSNNNAFPKPFPASTPARLVAGTNTPVTPAEFNIQATLTFDDSISAISAHTLEAMAARTVSRSRSDPPSSLESPVLHASSLPSPRSMAEPSPQQQQQQQHQLQQHQLQQHSTLGAAPSPFCRSISTESKRSAHSQYSATPSKQSVSTRTTESSSFDYWQREEQKYWVKMVARKDDTPAQPTSKSVRRSPAKSGNLVRLLSVVCRMMVAIIFDVCLLTFSCFVVIRVESLPIRPDTPTTPFLLVREICLPRILCTDWDPPDRSTTTGRLFLHQPIPNLLKYKLLLNYVVVLFLLVC